MREAAMLFASIAAKGKRGQGLIVPISRLKELGDQLVKDLRDKLGVVNPNNKNPSVPGDYPHLVTGDLQKSVAYQIIDGGIKLGYTPHSHGQWFGNDFDYGEFLANEKERKGPFDFLNENDTRAELDKVFGVGGYTVSNHPYEMIEL
jgi:hypothetical protein